MEFNIKAIVIIILCILVIALGVIYSIGISSEGSEKTHSFFTIPGGFFERGEEHLEDDVSTRCIIEGRRCDPDDPNCCDGLECLPIASGAYYTCQKP